MQVLPASSYKSRSQKFAEAMKGAGQAIGQFIPQHLAGKEQEREARNLGIDPAILKMPEQAQAAYFKNKFATSEGMTPLQEAQRKLAEARLEALKGQTALFDQLSGKTTTNDQNQAINTNESPISKIPVDQLNQMAAFAGQPGEAGILGNMAKSELERQEADRKFNREEDRYKKEQYDKSYDREKDYINKITDSAQASDEMDMRLDQMMTLKDLPTPALATTLEFLGLPSSVFSADAETMEKLSVDLTKNIQQFYGSRILQSEFNTFLRSIPTLKNTPEGKKRIIENMKKFNDLKRIEYAKMRQVMLEHEEKDKPLPKDFRQKVFESMRKDADSIAKEFKSGFNQPKQKEFKRQKVAPGTEISQELINEYIKDAKGNREQAYENAKEDGYS